MTGQSKTTTDHDSIKKWAEERNATPSKVKGYGGDESGILRFDFPGYEGDDELVSISWDDFFRIFDENNLALLYQEKTDKGEKSNFSKLVSRE